MPKTEFVDRGALQHMAKPSGWFQVGWSAEYDPGTVKPLRYFERDYVAYRTDTGRLVIADAFCPHFGAHLGHGGTVSGECITCPFHGWTWGPDGHNVAIPYSSRRNKSKRVLHHPVREVNGLVYLWHAADGEEPWWEPPVVPEFEEPADFYGHYPDGYTTWKHAPLFPQFVLENTVDYAHVKYVHGWVNVPDAEPVEESRASFRSVFSGAIESTRGQMPLRVDSTAFGVGLTVNRLEGIRDTVQVLGVTPVDGLHSDLLISVAVQRLDGDGEDVPGIVDAIRHAQLVTAYEQDLPIWANMRYNVTPPYPKEEAEDFIRLRKWSERFYPEPLPYRYR